MANNTFTFDDEQEPDPNDPAPEPTEEPQPEEGEGNNRTFLIIGVVLGGIILLSLICGAVYALVFLPGRQAAKLMADSTATANAIVSEREGIIQTATQLALLATPTMAATEAPKVATTTPLLPSTVTSIAGPTSEPGTATQQALLTQLYYAQLTAANQPPGTLTSVALTATQRAKVPATGFADEVGLPGLFILALVLMAVILLARRLRQVPVKQ